MLGIWISVPWCIAPLLTVMGMIVDFVWCLWELRYGIAYMMLTVMFIIAVHYSLTILYGCLN